ncbi:molybdenum cofactor guanylyltransferase MobA [Ferruginivarius sediminum]|uniref:Molybdenum cofactor guanylyltransferase n=1 Tax=Ferruginivarius sediminum TaxID=2661937 RepID=A0A369TEH6_9PROT|nr:molybdenum cofactor guanylyltransferase MobA [Ferruginivarius sediminum]RDD62775.1 molybdenum cofactor guanylyltransferase MobA [Ferruginivarius sediminum]
MTERTSADDRVCGVLLAGGQSRRMGGGDKALRPLGGRPLLAHIVERARPQVDALVLNANGDPARFREAGFDLPVAPDVVEGFAGPLAGVLTGMTWAAENAPACRWIATFACDAPFLPADLVARFLDAVKTEEADMACAASEGRSHPVFGLWPVDLRDDLHHAMVEEDIRKVDVWTARYRLATVPFPPAETGQGTIDPFFNTNRPEDLEEAERLAGHLAV